MNNTTTSNKQIIHNPKIHIVSDIPSLSEQEKSENTLIIGTHSGTFHADEIVAIALYSFTDSYENIYVVRTRDKDLLAQCNIAVDYGGGVYDHHREGYKEERKVDSYGNKIKFASAGLIFIHEKLGFANTIIDNFISSFKFNKSKNISKPIKDTIINSIDEKIVMPVDARDTGGKIKPPREDILDFIPSFNPLWVLSNDSLSFNKKFEEAFKVTRSVLSAKINETIVQMSKESEKESTTSNNDSQEVTTSNHFVEEIGISSLFNLLDPNQKLEKPSASSTSPDISDSSITSVWNQIGDEIITNQLKMLDPTNQIFSLYNNFEDKDLGKADSSEDSNNPKTNIYKAIAPTIKTVLEEHEQEIKNRILESVLKNLVEPISNTSGSSNMPNNTSYKNVLSFLNAFDISSIENDSTLVNQSKTDAKKVATSILQTKIQEIISAEYARETINILYKNPNFFSNGILEIPSQSMPWKEAICDINAQQKKSDHIVNFVIFPYPDGGWAAQCLPPSMENEFDQRIPLERNAYPEFWVHPGKFFARQNNVKEKVKKVLIKKLCTFSEMLETVDRWRSFYNDDNDFDFSDEDIKKEADRICKDYIDEDER